MDDIRNEVQEVFRQVFQDDRLTLTDSLTANDIPGWDSLEHVNLVIALEKRFGIRFATDEITRLREESQNVGSLIALIASKRK